MTMKACSHKHGCSGNYLLPWEEVAQMSAVIPSKSLESHSPRSVHMIHYLVFNSVKMASVDNFVIVITMDSNDIFGIL